MKKLSIGQFFSLLPIDNPGEMGYTTKKVITYSFAEVNAMQSHSPQFEFLRQVLLLSNRIQAYGDSFYSEFSAKQWHLLLYVQGFRNSPPTLNELAAQMGTSHQNTRQMVSRLEKKGFLSLSPDPDDRRKTRIELTERCAPLWEKYQQLQEQSIQALFRDIPLPQQEQALAVLQRLNKYFEKT